MTFGFIKAEKASFPISRMCRVLGVNPNASHATTRMMLGIARAACPQEHFRGLTARSGPRMITTAGHCCRTRR